PEPIEINEDTDISTLSAAQVYELNQNLLNETADVNRPLIDQILPISELRKEYERGSTTFVKQIDWLEAQGYQAIRRARGDGDCFYRSLSFAYVERLLKSPDPASAVSNALNVLSTTPAMLENVGFQKLVFEDFYEIFEGLLKNISIPHTPDAPTEEGGGVAGTGGMEEAILLSAFQNAEISNSIVMYMRLLTSAQIRIDPDTYQPFLFHPELGEPMSVREFCENFVEATGKEADHVQMTALSRALHVDIDVAYLDGRSGGGEEGHVEFVKFQQDQSDQQVGGGDGGPICLLYRPGHYDILVK
ncbi:cysteine proteinase, partial [Dendrothele bispora CBS 962.96]